MLSRQRSALLAVSMVSILQAAPVTAGPADDPWDGKPFSLSVKRVLEASRRVPLEEGNSIQVLLDEARFVLDDEGRVEFTFRLIYRVDEESAVQGWSAVSESWRPWYQDRPTIQARVVAPDGAVHELDPDHLGEYSDDTDSVSLFGDTKTLEGPLPGMRVGAVIEEVHVVRDHAPMFAAGGVRGFGFGRHVPVHRTRMIIDAPDGLPLHTKIFRLPGLEVQRKERKGRVVLRYEHGRLDPLDEDLRLAPGDVARSPGIRFSTGRSWRAVAQLYSDVVDEKIAASRVRGIVKEVVGKEKDRDRVLDRLLAHVHDSVRYTGIEFGEQSIIPTDPQTTLDRKFGDCKDKSTLLVALLRAAGIDAHVALLRTGPGEDVHPELPGMGFFNHAIVHVPGDPAIWIDPTSEFARPGELPTPDQSRLALIADRGTRSLVPVPQALPSANLRRETREVFFASQGPGRVVESTDVTGFFELRFRGAFSKRSDKDLREQLAAYVQSEYKAEDLGEFEISDPRELGEPMRVRVEALEGSRVWTSTTDAAVALGIGALVRDLPGLLTPDSLDEEAEDDRPRRQHPVLLPEPYVTEIHYRIPPPPGYELTALPENRERSFGPARMSEEYSVDEDGVVRASLRFDTVKALFTPEEADLLREEMAAFYTEQMPRVTFHQVGEAHLEAGRIREALEEFKALASRFPDEAVYRTKVARALLAAGLGRDARREARRAAELAPESLIAQKVLGLILAHDELGRKFVKGFDRRGAEAAFRKATEIDPEEPEALGELAILLEHDESGERRGAGARLEESIVHYTKLRELGSEHLTTTMMAVMLHAGQFEEARAVWKDAPRNRDRDAVYLAATALAAGADEAIREASRIADQAEHYRSILTGAGGSLFSTRSYEAAGALLAAGARGAPNSVEQLRRANLMGRVRRQDGAHRPLETPEAPAFRYLASVVLEGEDAAGGADVIRRSFLPSLLDEADPEMLEQLAETMHQEASSALRQGGLSLSHALDTFYSLTQFSVDGSPGVGFRVRLTSLGSESVTTGSLRFYVVRSGEEHYLVGHTGGLSPIGVLLLRWVEEGRLDHARRWLDWLVEDLMATQPPDILSRPPLTWLWTAGMEADADRVRAAAASLMVDGLYGDRPLGELRSAMEIFPDGEARVGLDLATAFIAQGSEDFELLLEVSDRLVGAYPRATQAFLFRGLALTRLGRHDDLEREAEERMKKFPGETEVELFWAEIPARRGDLAEYRRRMAARISSGRATSFDYNNLAWLDIVDGKIGEETVQNAQQAVALHNYADPGSLHTLATLYAETGQVAEARDVLLALLGERTSNDLEPVDWYILGRIAEHYGALDTALDAYAKVEKPEETEMEVISTYRLAERRIQEVTRDQAARAAADPQDAP